MCSKGERADVLTVSGIFVSEQSYDGPLWLLASLCLFPKRTIHAAAPWRVLGGWLYMWKMEVPATDSGPPGTKVLTLVWTNEGE